MIDCKYPYKFSLEKSMKQIPSERLNYLFFRDDIRKSFLIITAPLTVPLGTAE